MIPAPLFGEILPSHLCGDAETVELRDKQIVSCRGDAEPVFVNSACALEHLRCVQALWDDVGCVKGSVENKMLCSIIQKSDSTQLNKWLEALKFASSLSSEFWGVCGLLLAHEGMEEDVQFLCKRNYSYSRAIVEFSGVQLQVVGQLFETCTLEQLHTVAVELTELDAWTTTHSNWIDVWLTLALTCRRYSFKELWMCIPQEMHEHDGVVLFLLHNKQNCVFATLNITPRSADCAVQFLCDYVQCWDNTNLPCLKTLLRTGHLSNEHILQLILHIQYAEAHPLFQLNRCYRHLFWSQNFSIVRHLFDYPDSETQLLRSSMPFVVRGMNFQPFDLTRANDQEQLLFLYDDTRCKSFLFSVKCQPIH